GQSAEGAQAVVALRCVRHQGGITHLLRAAVGCDLDQPRIDRVDVPGGRGREVELEDVVVDVAGTVHGERPGDEAGRIQGAAERVDAGDDRAVALGQLEEGAAEPGHVKVTAGERPVEDR